MADTSQHELSEPHTNGAVDGLTEEEKSKMRPADIDADMREMERRKRVEMMMNSRLFREELERIIETQMKDGGAGPSGLLQQISDMMGAQGARFNSNVFKSSNCVVPINDIRGVESMGYAKGEKVLRCKLAAVFRLLDLYGWTQGVGGQITARLNQDQEHFLVNPYGLLYHEVTASSLVKVDMQGSVVEQGTTNFGVHVTGFQLHSTIHAARPDIKCIVHITTPSVIAVSSLKCGLLPLGQESIVIGEASVHQYIGGVFEPEEKEKIARNLGPVNKIMFLTNRGAICCGETVEEAFYNVYNTVLACETQLKLIPVGIDNLNLVSEESRKAIFDASRKPPVPLHPSVAEPSPLADKLEKRWRIGGTEFEALMRMLDNAGFRTGYIYRNPLVKGEPPRPRNDVEVPPAVSSLGYLLEEEELYRQGLWKGGRKGTDRSRWLNSPNVYQKVEILETGTPDPKKITKWVDQNAEEWVTDGSPTHSSTPVKIESALQFVPKNTNPKEFKQLQQQIKDYRRADKISAGPQSHILEGVTWDEAKKMQDATISATGEQVVLVGAASKGIIQRGFQHNAMVYKTPYAKNPFDAITDQELDQYKKDVERKQKGDPYDESQSESEGLSSFNVSRATHESSTAKSPIQSPVSVTSETEEESRDEPRVLRIETKQVPLPSQPEVVLSDEPIAAAVVVDSPIVQQALIQQVQEQSQNIIQQKVPVDATTEFLNEMRRTSVNPRNDLNRRDCQSSNSSSVSSGNSFGWPNEQYDEIHLEVARSRNVATRMTPLITEIVHKTENNTELNRTNVRTKRPPPVPPKPKPYIALRHAFFNNCLPPAESIQISNSTYNNHLDVNYRLEKTQVAQDSEFLNIPIDISSHVENRNNVSDREKSDKNLSGSRDTKLGNFSPKSNEEINLNDVVSVSTDVMKESNRPKDRSNDSETVFRRTIELSHKPVIVGAILKNVNDLHTLCIGSNARSDIPELNEIQTENENEEDNLLNLSDENGNPCEMFNKSLVDQEIGEFDIEDSITDDNSNPIAAEVPVKNLNERKEDRIKMLKKNSIDNEVALDSLVEDIVNNNPEQKISDHELDNETGNYSPEEFTTPPRASNYMRLDSLTEVINSIKTNLTPTKMLLSVLPESNISSKYNLDSMNMSLLYSLTPTNDDTDVAERKIKNKNKANDKSDESFNNSAEYKRLDSCNTEASVHDEETEFIWVDLTTDTKQDDEHNPQSNETIDLLDSSMESLNDVDNVSEQGSDILELPYSTVQELRETDGESFNHDMKTMANQIIAELGDIEMYAHASNFIDEILYDVSCLKLDENCSEQTVAEIVQDKLHALGAAKNIADSLISDLPCYDEEVVVSTEENHNREPLRRQDCSEKVIVIDEIVHHIIDNFDSIKISSLESSPDSYNLKKVKESTNTELKEMQNSFKIETEENIDSQTDQEFISLDEKSPDDAIKENETNSDYENIETEEEVEVVTIIDIDEELNLVPQVEREDSETQEIKIDTSPSCQTLEISVDGLFRSEGHENFAESSPNRYHSSEERFFITLESFSPSNRSRNFIRDVSESPDDSENEVNDPSEFEEQINDREEYYSKCEFGQSPLDCDECSFVNFKKYDPVEGHTEYDGNRSFLDYTNAKSSLENTESDITDQDTLGEAILEFCTIARPGSTAESLELNFSIERRDRNEIEENRFVDTRETDFNQNSEIPEKKTEELHGQTSQTEELAECTQCTCCAGGTSLDFLSPGHLPPISEEANESLDNHSCTKAEEKYSDERQTSLSSRQDNSLKVNSEIEFDYLDFLSDSEILIAEWFENYIATTSQDDKTPLKSPDLSVVSSESMNTFDYFSCKEDSHSTAFQSLQNTTESSSKIEKDYESDVEVIYVADKANNKHDRTYTLSDTSVNSLDTVSSIESDELKRTGKIIDATYSADISTNMDETRFQTQESLDPISSPSSSDTRLSNEDENCFDTTENMADVSTNLLFSRLQRDGCSGMEENETEEVNGVESSPVSNSENENEAQDCMIYSYDTKEFMRLEKALAEKNETELDIVNCTCADANCEIIPTSQNLDDDVNCLSPISLPPRYEDTNLYKVVSEINLGDDIIGRVASDVNESHTY